MSFYDDPDRLSYPEAETLVREYLRKTQRERTTSVGVLDWSDYPNTHHNRRRVFEELQRYATPMDIQRGGRRLFDIPEEIQ